MKKSSILILLPDLCGGGAERLHVNLANYWHSQGVKVEFALMNKTGDLLKLLPADVGVFDLAANRIRQVVFPLARHLRKSRPDYIIAAMWPLTSIAVVAWCLAGRPGRLFLSDHNQLSISCAQELKTPLWLLRSVTRLTYPLATGLIAVSEGVKQDLCRLGGLDDSMVRVIYNPTATGVSPHRESSRTREALWGSGFDRHILSVGTLKAQKDHANLITAFSKLPLSLNAKLTILGEGALHAELSALIEKLGLQDRVAMPGFMVDPYPWFRSADLFVLSSRWEGFGNVIVEALECGVPVVSTDCQSGPAEILENGRYGKLVPVQDPSSLATAMIESLTKPVNREALMTRAKAFAVSTIADQYFAYFSRPRG
ncbi:MAG: glycosyltransferase [Burkholderiaceae bacterium]|nr:glycosyltransferase [Burkholderiaceae bacterium]